jgi:hypothetical protein
MQDRIKGSKIFIKIDIRKGYYKIKMKKSEFAESIKKKL